MSTKKLLLISVLVGLMFGLLVSIPLITENVGGEFWTRVGNPEIGPKDYDLSMMSVVLAVWWVIGVALTLPFVWLVYAACPCNNSTL